MEPLNFDSRDSIKEAEPKSSISPRKRKAEDVSVQTSLTKSSASTNSSSEPSIKKRSDSLTGADFKVWIWDLDETLIVFQSLLQGSFAAQSGKDAASCQSAGETMEALILRLAEDRFFFNDLEDDHPAHVADVEKEAEAARVDVDAIARFNRVTKEETIVGNGLTKGAERKETLYARFCSIKKCYDDARNSPETLLSPEMEAEWKNVRKRIESLSDSWCSRHARECLEVIDRREKNVSVIVSSTQLAPCYAKILLHGLARFFPFQNVYSASGVNKVTCFEKIRTRFGRDAQYVVVGDGAEEEVAADRLGFTFWKVGKLKDLTSLGTALRLNYM